MISYKVQLLRHTWVTAFTRKEAVLQNESVKLYNLDNWNGNYISGLRWSYYKLNAPNSLKMQKITLTDVRSDVTLPFQSQVKCHLQNLFNVDPNEAFPQADFYSTPELSESLRGKVICVSIALSEKSVRVRPATLKQLKSFFDKDIVAIMKESEYEITYLLI